jgi:hypothetical protein
MSWRLQSTPRDSSWCLQAACHIKLGKWDAAIDACDAALKLAPLDVKALYRRTISASLPPFFAVTPNSPASSAARSRPSITTIAASRSCYLDFLSSFATARSFLFHATTTPIFPVYHGSLTHLMFICWAMQARKHTRRMTMWRKRSRTQHKRPGWTQRTAQPSNWRTRSCRGFHPSEITRCTVDTTALRHSLFLIHLAVHYARCICVSPSRSDYCTTQPRIVDIDRGDWE